MKERCNPRHYEPIPNWYDAEESSVEFEASNYQTSDKSLYFSTTPRLFDEQIWETSGVAIGDASPFGGVYLRNLQPLFRYITAPDSIYVVRGAMWANVPCIPIGGTPENLIGKANTFEPETGHHNRKRPQPIFTKEFKRNAKGTWKNSDDLVRHSVHKYDSSNTLEVLIETSKPLPKPIVWEDGTSVDTSLPQGVPALAAKNIDFLIRQTPIRTDSLGQITIQGTSYPVESHYVRVKRPYMTKRCWSHEEYAIFCELNLPCTLGMPDPSKMIAARVVCYRAGLYSSRIDSMTMVQKEPVPSSEAKKMVPEIIALIKDDQFVSSCLTNALARLINWRDNGRLTEEITLGYVKKAMELTGWNIVREKIVSQNKLNNSLNERLASIQWTRVFAPCSVHNLQTMFAMDRLETWGVLDARMFAPVFCPTAKNVADLLNPELGVCGTKLVSQCYNVLTTLRSEALASLLYPQQIAPLQNAYDRLQSMGLFVIQTNFSKYFVKNPFGLEAIPFNHRNPAFIDLCGELAVASQHGFGEKEQQDSPLMKFLSSQYGDAFGHIRWQQLSTEHEQLFYSIDQFEYCEKED